MASILSLSEHKRMTRYYSPELRQRFAATVVILRLILADYFRIEPVAIQLLRRSSFCGEGYGAPYVVTSDPSDNVEISMSRSKNTALFAVSSLGRIGVDLEYVNSEFDWHKAAPTAFHPAELALLSSSEQPDWSRRCFQQWAHKEAYLKAQGIGLWSRPNEVICPQSQPKDNWTILELDVPPEYVAALATEGRCSALLMNI